MTDTNATTGAYDALMRHREAVEAFTAFAALFPLNDSLSPLLRLLSANLSDTLISLEPFALADSVQR